MQTTNKHQTPLERLNSDKQKFRNLCTTQEQKLQDDFTYLHENMGSLLLSGFSNLLFPKTKSKTPAPDAKTNTLAHSSEHSNGHLNASDYFTIALGAVPLVWDFTRPLVMTWGIKKVREWLIKKIFRRKK